MRQYNREKAKRPWARKGLQWKSRRICIGKSEELERKARFFAGCMGEQRFCEAKSRPVRVKPQKMRHTDTEKNKWVCPE
jgi:hypothetical protein